MQRMAWAVGLAGTLTLLMGCANTYSLSQSETSGKIAIHPDANLAGAQLADKNLTAAPLDRANLSGATLSKSAMKGVMSRDSRLYRARLNDANLQDADLGGANLFGADLYDADLRNATLRNADLRLADMRLVDLADADLRGAFLHGANLSETDLSTAELSGAIYDAETVFPEGFDPWEANMVYWRLNERLLYTHRHRRSRVGGLYGGYWRGWSH